MAAPGSVSAAAAELIGPDFDEAWEELDSDGDGKVTNAELSITLMDWSTPLPPPPAVVTPSELPEVARHGHCHCGADNSSASHASDVLIKLLKANTKLTAVMAAVIENNGMLAARVHQLEESESGASVGGGA